MPDGSRCTVQTAIDKSMLTYTYVHARVCIGTEHSASNRIALLDPSQLMINVVHTSTGTIVCSTFCRHCSSHLDEVHNPSWTDCAAVGNGFQ